MPLTIIRNDITRVKADAIVNAANNSLLGGEGVDGAIHKAAGKGLLEECKTLGGCETGDAKITGGYDMPCKYIIHTVGPIWRGGSNNEENLLYSCYKKSLELAKEHNCQSIAFPLISAGAYGYPKRQAVNVARSAFEKFLENEDMDITLVLFDKETLLLNDELNGKIKKYIDDIYAEEHYPQSLEQEMRMLNEPCSNVYIPPKKINSPEIVKKFSISSMEKRIENADISFSEMLFKLIDERGMKDAEVYRAANVSRQVFSKIRSDKRYRPKKNTVFGFAIALRLTLSQTDELLRTAGYAISRNDKSDIIISYHIERGKYQVYELNEVLFSYDLPLIGAKYL